MKKINFFGKKDRNELESNEVSDQKYEHQIGKYKIFLKNTHMLEKYQAQYPLYDRFLPYFCSFLEGLIIDIGANIGDTSISIFSQNDKCFIIGIEPDHDFFEDCLESIKINNLQNRFLGVQKFISTKKGAYVIEKDKTSSTGSINIDNTSEENNTISFSELIQLFPSELSENFDMLKVDTDGFDWDVINSFAEAKDGLSSKPRFVFFEMQTFLNNDADKTSQRQEMSDKYTDSIRKLQNMNYSHFSLFDNFGTFVMTTNSVEEIIIMNEYVIRSQIYNRHSTIFYFDVLAYSESELEFTKNKITEFYV